MLHRAAATIREFPATLSFPRPPALIRPPRVEFPAQLSLFLSLPLFLFHSTRQPHRPISRVLYLLATTAAPADFAFKFGKFAGVGK